MATKRARQQRSERDRRRARAQAAAAGRRQRRQRLVVGAVAGTLAVAMVASLGVGFLAGDDDPGTDQPEVELEEAPPPVEIVPPEPGATLTGETPCPSTDGTQERTTSFDTPPPTCIDPQLTYELALATSEGEVVVAVDTTDVEAANLLVTNSRYGVYDDVSFWLVVEDGLAITGDLGSGDAGFTIPARPAERAYRAGDVVMWADENDGIGTRFAIVASDLVAEVLNTAERAHPIVGTVGAGSGVIESILAAAGAPGGVAPLADVRIATARVTETG